MSRLGPTGLTQLLTDIKTWITTKLGNYVTTDTTQTVTGKKLFTASSIQLDSVTSMSGSTMFIDTSASAPRGEFPAETHRVGRIYIGDNTSYNGAWFIVDPTIDTNRAYYRMVTTNPDNTDSARFSICWDSRYEGVHRRRNISMGDLLPSGASTYNLGESGNAWQDAYINKIHGISDYTNLKTNTFNVNTTLTHGGSGRRVILAMGAITLTVPAPEEGSWFLIKAVNGLVTLNLASNVTVTGITAVAFSGPIHLQPNESILLCYYSSTIYNATISTIRRSGVVGRTGNVPSENPKHWFKIAENYVTATYRDPFICLRVFESTTGNTIGTLCAHCRINNTVGVVDTSNCYLQWQDAGAGFNLSKYALTTNETSGTGVTISLWCQLTGGYSSLKFEVVSECGQSDQLGNPEWVLTRRRQADGDLAELLDTDFTKIVYSTLTTLKNDTTGKASNVTGTVAIANGGTGATTRLNAVKNLTNESVGTPTHFLAITTNWGKAGYTTVAQAKTVLGITGDMGSHSDSEYVHKTGDETISGDKTFANSKVIVGRNTDVGSAIQLINSDVVGDSANGSSGFEVYGSSISDDNKIGGLTVGEYSNNGGAYATIEVNRTVSGVKTTTAIRSLIRSDGSKEFSPSTDNDIKLGHSSFRWSAIYGNTYYYGSNNVEFSTKFVTTDTAQTVAGTKTFNGDKIVITQGNGYRMVCNTDGGASGYGVFQRVDGSSWYLMVTAQNDALGSWTSARPASMNLSTGVLSINGNAATATQFSANKSVTLTGDVTGTASSKAGWSVATTLANSGVTAGSYGPATAASPAHGGTFSVPYVTVDAKGRVTAASSITITLPSDSNTDTLMTQNVSTTDNTYPILLCATANATSNQGAKTGIFGSGVKVNPKTSVVSAKGFSGVPTGNTYVNAVKDGGALVNSQATAWGAIWRAPTKDYQVAGATWSSTNNNVYICYSVTNTNVEAGTNTMAKSLVWAADTGTLTTTTFSGALSGNASSATEFSANKDVTLTGDVTGTASSKAGWSVATTLANSGVTAGTYGPSADVTGSNNATILVPEITVDAKGRVTAVNNRTYTSVNTDNDKKVYQYYKSDNDVYRLLFSNNAGNTATSNVGAAYSGLNNSLYVNPSTGALYATKLYSNGVEVLTAHQSLSNYVTLNTAQEITNTKTFKDANTVVKRTDIEAGNTLPSADKLARNIFQDKNGKELGSIYYYKNPSGNTGLCLRAGDWFSESEGVYSLNASGTNRRAELVLYTNSSGDCCIQPNGLFSAHLKPLNSSICLAEYGKPFGVAYVNQVRFTNATLQVDVDIAATEEHSIGFFGKNNGPLSYITFQKRPSFKDRVAIRIQTASNSYKSYDFDATCFYPESSNSVDIGSTTNIFKNIYCNNYYKGTTAFGDIVTHNASEFLTSHQSLSNYVTLDGTQTIAGTKTFSSTISGSISGNAGTATQFSANTTVALTGDATGTSAGSKKGWSVPVTLANSGVTAGSYGPATAASPAHGGTFSVPYVTVDAKGRVTAASTVTITLPADSNTDTKVTQTVTNDNACYPLLIANTASASHTGSEPTTETDEVRKAYNINVQARYGFIYARNSYTADNLKGSVAGGNRTSAAFYGSTYDGATVGGVELGRVDKYGNRYSRLYATNHITDGALAPDGTAVAATFDVGVLADGTKYLNTGAGWYCNVYPTANNTRTLGTSSLRWKECYSNAYYLGTTAFGDIVTHNASEFLTSHQSLSSCVKNVVTNNQTIKSTGITRGTAPSSAQTFGIAFSDNNNKSIGNVYGQYATDKSTYVGLYAYKGTTTSNGDNASVRVGYDASGNAYTYAPTPATADNSTQIATTAFVKAQGYLTSHQSLANYVTTNTDQSISGIKSHSKHISILGDYIGNESSTNGRSCLYLKANRDTDGKSGLYVTKFRQNVAQGSMGNSDVVFLSHDILENETRTNAGFVESYSNWTNNVPGGISVYSTIATRNLGTSAKPWTNAYITNLNLNGNVFDPTSVSGNIGDIVFASAYYDDITGTLSLNLTVSGNALHLAGFNNDTLVWNADAASFSGTWKLLGLGKPTGTSFIVRTGLWKRIL